MTLEAEFMHGNKIQLHKNYELNTYPYGCVLCSSLSGSSLGSLQSVAQWHANT